MCEFVLCNFLKIFHVHYLVCSGSGSRSSSCYNYSASSKKCSCPMKPINSQFKFISKFVILDNNNSHGYQKMFVCVSKEMSSKAQCLLLESLKYLKSALSQFKL